MATIKVKRYNHSFVQMDKKPLENKELSWQAKGLFAYLMTLPEDWEINIADLSNRSKNGRDSTAAILKELIQAGHISKRRRQNADTGKFEGYNYTIYENKHDNPEYTETAKPVNGKSVNGFSVNGKSVTNNKPILTNKTITNKPIKEREVLTFEERSVKDFEEKVLPNLQFPESWQDNKPLLKYFAAYLQAVNKKNPQRFKHLDQAQKLIKDAYSITQQGHSLTYLKKLIDLCANKGWMSIEARYLEDDEKKTILPTFRKLV